MLSVSHSKGLAAPLSKGCKESLCLDNTWREFISQGKDLVFCLPYLWGKIVPFQKDFSPSEEQLELHKLAHELQPTAGCIAIFHKCCCYTKCGSITASLTLRSHWGYVTDVSKYHNAGKLSMDKKILRFLFKTYNTLHSCHNFPAGSWEAARVAPICEMSLLIASYYYRWGSAVIIQSREIWC